MVLCLVAVLWALRVALWSPPDLSGEPGRDPWVRVPGVAHIHTTFSDGGGTPEEVVAEAKAAGLSFVVITEHNNVDPKPFQGYHDGVLALVGTEVSTQQGHIVGYGVSDPAFRFSGNADDALFDIRDLGGFAAAAHPLSPREDLRFTAWDLPGPWGLELVNGDSQWREAGWLSLGRMLLEYGLNRRYALLGSLSPPWENILRWDRMLRQRDVVGFFGADAHSRVPLWGDVGIRFPSYRAIFELQRSYVLLDAPLSGEAALDEVAILDALEQGRSYIGISALGDASGFFFRGRLGERFVVMGETVAPDPQLVLEAGGRLPDGAMLRVFHDGTHFESCREGWSLEGPEPGVYRVEVEAPGWDLPWVISNPIYVFDQEAAEERRQRSAWPEPPPVPEAVAVIDSFDGPTAFHPEFDDSSAMEPEVVEAGAGPEGEAAARIGFRLGHPGPGRPYTWCALVDRSERDLSGREGLVFSIRGDGVYRIWVQVRDHNPASLDEETEWWFSSVRTSEEWQRLAVPFSRLRSLNENSDGRLDLDRVRGVVFVLDYAAVKPGTSGTIWLDDLGVY